MSRAAPVRDGGAKERAAGPLRAAQAVVRTAAVVAVLLPILNGQKDVMVRSDEGRIVRAVAGAREQLGMTNAELRNYLAAKIETDTLSVAPYLDAGRVLLVLARFDDAIPYALQLELREAMGRPKSITVPTGHATAALYLFYLRARVLEFFDATLSRPGIPVSTAPLPGVTICSLHSALAAHYREPPALPTIDH